jgi:hypothetical protein
VSAKFVTAVALYGPKEGSLKELLQVVQEILRKQMEADFLPYTLEQIHSTLIRLDWLTDGQVGVAVNKRYYEIAGSADPMALDRALKILRSSLEYPCRIRIGGYRPDSEVTFSSRGMHPYDRTFSIQGQAFVLMGWPVSTIARGISAKPLDDLRRSMNDANIMHWYHESLTDIDNDFHLVVGHHADAPSAKASEAVEEVRKYLANHPVEIDVGISQVAIVTSDSPTLKPAQFIGRIPEDRKAIIELFR